MTANPITSTTATPKVAILVQPVQPGSFSDSSGHGAGPQISLSDSDRENNGCENVRSGMNKSSQNLNRVIKKLIIH